MRFGKSTRVQRGVRFLPDTALLSGPSRSSRTSAVRRATMAISPARSRPHARIARSCAARGNRLPWQTTPSAAPPGAPPLLRGRARPAPSDGARTAIDGCHGNHRPRRGLWPRRERGACTETFQNCHAARITRIARFFRPKAVDGAKSNEPRPPRGLLRAFFGLVRARSEHSRRRAYRRSLEQGLARIDALTFSKRLTRRANRSRATSSSRFETDSRDQERLTTFSLEGLLATRHDNPITSARRFAF